MMRPIAASVAFGAALALSACSDDAREAPSGDAAGAEEAAASPEAPEVRPTLTYYTIPG